MSISLGGVGVWGRSTAWSEISTGERAETISELEELGYGALWLGVSPGDLELPEELLAATRRIVVATGIINIWSNPADLVTAAYHQVYGDHPERILLGLGSSHAPMVGDAYKRPLSRLRAYLDELDAQESPVPIAHRVLAALGPKALALAAERAAGAHPYLVTPDHTRIARETMGPGALLAVEQKAVLESDPVRARELARARVGPYMALPNYTNNLLRLGFAEADFADAGSDRLLDALVAWGEEDAILARVREHREAGADHVCLQVLNGAVPREQWRRLAPALGGA
jgi:probable F420-dependent oxidoreductase